MNRALCSQEMPVWHQKDLGRGYQKCDMMLSVFTVVFQLDWSPHQLKDGNRTQVMR